MRRLLACVSMAACGNIAAAGASAQASAEGGHWQVAAEGQVVAVYDRGVRVKALDAVSRDGHDRSFAVAIHYQPARRSFVIAFDSLAELWELSIDPQAAPIFDGLVHDYRMGEGLAEPGYLGARRTRLEAPLSELAFDDSGAYVIGRAAAQAANRTLLYLVQLDIRRTIGRFPVGGEPDIAGVRSLRRGTRQLLRVPDRQGGPATLVDLQRARLVTDDEGVGPAR
jgi:hypothetical protein